MTGATGGFGRVIVFRLAGGGWDVIMRRTRPGQGPGPRGGGRRAGLALRTVQLDVASEESCRQALQESAEMTGGGPWALVNNA